MTPKPVALVLAPAAALMLAACGGERMPPKALAQARADFYRTSSGVAATVDPADVHEADVALRRAESAYAWAPDAPLTNDLAIIADRRALLAQANAGTLDAQQQAERAVAAIADAQQQQREAAGANASSSGEALGSAEQQPQDQRAVAADEQAQLQDMRARLKGARAAIARVATVQDDSRGMVIMLPGDALFKTGKSDIGPAGLAKLDVVARALGRGDESISVVGHADDVGSHDHDVTLSQDRADAVRDYLVSKGIAKERLETRGEGSNVAAADGGSAQGRAQDRGIEIVVHPKK